MGTQGKVKQCISWLVVLYLVSHLVMSGQIEWQLTPGSVDEMLCAFSNPLIVAAGPQESFGDGPGNR